MMPIRLRCSEHFSNLYRKKCQISIVYLVFLYIYLRLKGKIYQFYAIIWKLLSIIGCTLYLICTWNSVL